MLIGVAAKGVLALRIEVGGRAAHGSTPWEGDNAITKAISVFRGIESLPFSRQSSELFDRPSINLGRIMGGDALNKVPDTCVIDVDIRYLPEQDPEAILAQIADDPRHRGRHRPSSARRSRSTPTPPSSARWARRRPRTTQDEVTSIGRDGASDAVSFIRAGTPAVEFGPVGGGHHGPEEWVSIASLASYRRTLCDFAARPARGDQRGCRRERRRARRRSEHERPRRCRGPPRTEEEPKGLGLTEEFARLEDEIQREGGPREVRFDETDSTEFVVAARAAVARPTSGRPPRRSSRRKRSRARPMRPRAPWPRRARRPHPTRPTEDRPSEAEQPEVDPAEAEAERRRSPRGPTRTGRPTPRTRPTPSEAPASRALPSTPPPPSTRSSGPSRSRRGAPHRWPARPVAPGRSPLRRSPLDGDVEDTTPALWWRFLTASVADRGSRPPPRSSVSSCSSSTDVAANLNPIPEVQGKLDAARARRPADDPDPRLRQAVEHAGRPGPLRHDDAAPRRRRERRPLAVLAAARPQGRHPRLRGRQAQRGLHGRRGQEDAEDGQGADSASRSTTSSTSTSRASPRPSTRSTASTSTSTATTSTTTRGV